MKKNVITLVTILFLVVTTGPTFAGYNGYHHYRPYPYGGYSYHHGHSDGDVWVALGAGLLTGCLISYMVNTPPSHTVVYSNPEPVVAPSPSRVVVKEYSYTPSLQIPASPPSQIPASQKVLVTAQELNVRTGPGFNHAIAGYVVLGEALQVLGSAPGWFYVKTVSGLQGWVMVTYTSPEALPLG